MGAYSVQTVMVELLLRLWEFYDLLRPKLVVRKLVVGYLHDPRCVERSGEYKQEGFKTNLVIIKSRMEESNDMTDIQYHP